MSVMKKRVVDVRAGDRLRTLYTDIPFRVETVTPQDDGTVRLDGVNLATGLPCWWKFFPTEMIVVEAP